MAAPTITEIFYHWACNDRSVPVSAAVAALREQTIDALKQAIDTHNHAQALVYWNRYVDAYDAENGEDSHFNRMSQCP